MPRLKTRVPKYRKNGKYAMVSIDGNTISLGRYGTKESKEKYKQLIADWEANGREVKGPEFTVAELVIEWLESPQMQNNHKDEIGGCKRACRVLVETCGSLNVSDFGLAELIGIRDKIANTKKDDGKPRKLSYVKKAITRITQAFRWGSQRGKVPTSVIQGLALLPELKPNDSLAVESEPVVPAEHKEIEATIKVLRNPMIKDMIRLQIEIGGRPGELFELKPSIIDTSETPWVCDLRKHKTAWKGKKRIIYFNKRARKILAPYMDPKREYCFLNRSGTQMKRNSYSRPIKLAQKKNGLREWYPYKLRHRAGTDIANERGLLAAQEVLGHASPVMTANYLGFANLDRAREYASD